MSLGNLIVWKSDATYSFSSRHLTRIEKLNKKYQRQPTVSLGRANHLDPCILVIREENISTTSILYRPAYLLVQYSTDAAVLHYLLRIICFTYCLS